MKIFYFFCCLFLNVFPCLVQAVGLNDAPEDPKKNIVRFLDQESWVKILRLNKEFYELTPQAITAIKVKGTSASEVIEKLTALLFKDDAHGKVYKFLESLNLVGSRIGDDELGTVVDFIQEHFPNIKSLNLSRNRIGNVGIANLVGLTGLTQLQTLDLSDNGIGNVGIANLVGLTRLTQLQTLDLSDNDIRDTGVAHLAGFNQLKTLDLSWNDIGNAGVAHLAGLNQLKILSLSYNSIGDAGAAHLAGLTQLKELKLSGIEATSIDALKQALPNCVIEF